MKLKYARWYALLAVMLFGIDRLTKYMVINTISHLQLNSFVSCDLVFNRGISFGLFHSESGSVFIAVNILIGSIIALLCWHTYHRLMHDQTIIGEIFIFSGAISNILDRYVYAGVVDFIALSYQDWHFAVFNVADIFIFCGVMIMLFLEYRTLWKK